MVLAKDINSLSFGGNQYKKNYVGKKVKVNSNATEVTIDDVSYRFNYGTSSGKYIQGQTGTVIGVVYGQMATANNDNRVWKEALVIKGNNFSTAVFIDDVTFI